MLALIPIVLDIGMKIIGFFLTKAEEKNAAEKQLAAFFKSLEAMNKRAATMRTKYQDAEERMNSM